MKDKEASVDILKMFTAMMAVLTAVVIAAFVVFFNQVAEAREEAVREIENIEKLYELGIDNDFKELVAKYKQQRVVASREGLKSWLQKKNARGVLNVTQWDDQGIKNATGRSPRLERVKMIIKSVPLQNLTGFLFDVQNQWPGLRIEDLTINNFKLDQGWDASVTISVIRPEERDDRES